MRKSGVALVVLTSLLFVVVLLWTYTAFFSSSVLFAPSQTNSYESRVSVGDRVAIQDVGGLGDGIDFGAITEFPLYNANGTENHAGTGSITHYNITRDPSSNVDLEVCIHADNNLTETQLGIATISLANETFYYGSTTSSATPSVLNEVPLTLDDQIASSLMDDINPTTHYRFWLDVTSSDQAPGDYNNTVLFKIQRAGIGCP